SCSAKSEFTNPSAKMSSSTFTREPGNASAMKPLIRAMSAGRAMYAVLRTRRSLRRDVVAEEAAAALATEDSRVDHLAKQRTGSILVVAEPVLQRLDRQQDRVESDQVGGLERAHLVTEAAAKDPVDLLGRGDALVHEINGLVDREHEDAVRDEPGR